MTKLTIPLDGEGFEVPSFVKKIVRETIFELFFIITQYIIKLRKCFFRRLGHNFRNDGRDSFSFLMTKRVSNTSVYYTKVFKTKQTHRIQLQNTQNRFLYFFNDKTSVIEIPALK